MPYCSGKIERFFNGMPVRGARGSMACDTGTHLIIARRGRGDKGYTLTAARGELLRERTFPTASATQDQNEPWSRRGRGSRRFLGREMLFLVAVQAGTHLSRIGDIIALPYHDYSTTALVLMLCCPWRHNMKEKRMVRGHLALRQGLCPCTP